MEGVSIIKLQRYDFIFGSRGFLSRRCPFSYWPTAVIKHRVVLYHNLKFTYIKIWQQMAFAEAYMFRTPLRCLTARDAVSLKSYTMRISFSFSVSSAPILTIKSEMLNEFKV